MNLNGSIWKQPVIYDWRPKAFPECHTFSHEHSSFPINSHKTLQTHGRSGSHPPRPYLKIQTNKKATPLVPSLSEDVVVITTMNPKLNDLNQPPILSPPKIPNPHAKPILIDEENSSSDSLEDSTNIPSTSNSMTTRSATMQSPQ